ncbi:putative carboxylesterase 3 [Raphanus sativus]|nr:putative carboxylesterase 3 [Raphanus sativus]
MLRRITSSSSLCSPPLFFRLLRQFPRSNFSQSSSRTTISISNHHHVCRLTLRSICSHSSSDLVSEHPPFVKIYKDGRVERLSGTQTLPASLTPQNGVVSKDVVYSPKHNLSARLFLPHKAKELAGCNKLPILIYIHGGAMDRRVPLLSHLPQFLDRGCESRELLGGVGSVPPCAGASDSGGVRGFVVCDPVGVLTLRWLFWSKDPVDEHDVQDVETRRGVAEVWEKIASPNSVNGTDDPLFNVVGSDSDFPGWDVRKFWLLWLGKICFCGKVWLCGEAEEEWVERRWEVVAEGDEDHCFHLLNPDSENAPKFMKKFVEFITS